MRLKDRVAIVTGAAMGLGKATALLFAEQGAQVIVADIDMDGARETASEAVNRGGRAEAKKIDLSDVAGIRTFVQDIVNSYGKVDVLVNNASRFSTTSILDMTEQEWDQVLDVNLRGTFFMSQPVVAGLIERKSGVIINISSLSAKRGGVTSGMNYASSKGGVMVLTKGFARFCAPHGIRVNGVVPSFMDTPMFRSLPDEKQKQAAKAIPLGRIADPRELAYAVLFLASDEASFITGEILDVDGGLQPD
jgi:3-oxoacyl-[acyl-carrier protein] reductase